MYAKMVLDVLSGILEVLFEFEESEGETGMREVICPICGNKKKEDPVCRSCGWKFHQDVISYQTVYPIGNAQKNNYVQDMFYARQKYAALIAEKMQGSRNSERASGMPSDTEKQDAGQNGGRESADRKTEREGTWEQALWEEALRHREEGERKAVSEATVEAFSEKEHREAKETKSEIKKREGRQKICSAVKCLVAVWLGIGSLYAWYLILSRLDMVSLKNLSGAGGVLLFTTAACVFFQGMLIWKKAEGQIWTGAVGALLLTVCLSLVMAGENGNAPINVVFWNMTFHTTVSGVIPAASILPAELMAYATYRIHQASADVSFMKRTAIVLALAAAVEIGVLNMAGWMLLCGSPLSNILNFGESYPLSLYEVLLPMYGNVAIPLLIEWLLLCLLNRTRKKLFRKNGRDMLRAAAVPVISVLAGAWIIAILQRKFQIWWNYGLSVNGRWFLLILPVLLFFYIGYYIFEWDPRTPFERAALYIGRRKLFLAAVICVPGLMIGVGIYGARIALGLEWQIGVGLLLVLLYMWVKKYGETMGEFYMTKRAKRELAYYWCIAAITGCIGIALCYLSLTVMKGLSIGLKEYFIYGVSFGIFMADLGMGILWGQRR